MLDGSTSNRRMTTGAKVAPAGGVVEVEGVTGDKYPLTFRWKNNEKRVTLYGRKCRLIARGAKGSVMIEFENGQREIVSWRSVN
jgi:hypothetical protein